MSWQRLLAHFCLALATTPTTICNLYRGGVVLHRGEYLPMQPIRMTCLTRKVLDSRHLKIKKLSRTCLSFKLTKLIS